VFLKEIKIKNFRGYGENPNNSDGFFIFDQLDSQLVVFHGFNGHGKTSFFEAVEWCLTDTVARLEKMYKSDGGAYSANDLNRSHYLKFYPVNSNLRAAAEREVFVEITFTNGFMVTRRSHSKVLRVSDSSDYSSTVMFCEEGGIPQQVTNEELINKLTEGSKNSESFIKAFLLSQDGIADFLRKTSPEERKTLFMRFLQQEQLTQHIGQLRMYTNGNNQLSRRKTELEQQRSSILMQIEQINTYLKNIGYDDLESYATQFENAYKQLKPFIKSHNIYHALSLDLLMYPETLSFKGFINILQAATGVLEKSNNMKGRLEANQTELLVIRLNISKLMKLQEAEQIIRRHYYAETIKGGDIEGIQKEQEAISIDKEKVAQLRKGNSTKYNGINEYSNLFVFSPQTIDSINKKVSSDFWDRSLEDIIRWNKYKMDYSELIRTLDFPVSSPEVDDKKVPEIQTRYIELNRERFEIENKLQKLKEQRVVLSSLNEQYQEVLNHAKEYIHEHRDTVDCCPICLNDFSSTYHETSEIDFRVPDLLLEIIDRTVANGDDAVKKLVEEETSLNDELVKLNRTISDEALNPLNKWVRESRQVFTLIDRAVRDKLIQVEKDITKQEEFIRQREKGNAEQWEKLKASCRVLFGENVELKDVDRKRLEEYLLTKKHWMDTNLKEIDFDHEPTLDEVISKIAVVRNEKGMAAYYPDNVAELDKQEMINKRSSIFVSYLIIRLEELLKLKVPADVEVYFSRYDQLEQELTDLTEKFELISDLQQQVRNKYTELVGKQNQILGDELHGHPVISWVYKAINPHTQYKDLKVIVNQHGTHYTSEEIQESLYLDQIFSQSQLNILALSTFLGIGLTQRYSALEQLLLDDPIQSMDDVNVLAFIDVLRAILDTERNSKRLIISTHDDNFAELLAVKMRNKNITHYFIDGYGHEGPVIKKIG
jgi:DNA repair protein SbcC/Rad50